MVATSDIQLTLSFKKSITSVASLMKSYNLQDAATQLKRIRQDKAGRKKGTINSEEEDLQQILSDVVDIMGCQGMKSKGLLDTNMNTMMTRLEMFVPE